MVSGVQQLWEKYVTITDQLLTYKNTILLEYHLSVKDVIENFEVRDDDIWLCGFPKSGTTWSQEMIWNIANDLNFEAAKVNLFERFPYFEYSSMNAIEAPTSNEKDSEASIPAYFQNSFEYIKKIPSPRFIKTHLPFHLLPRQLRSNEKNCKIVYVWRNPKDTCISYYHFEKWMNWYTGDFENYCKLFLKDGVVYGPYWNHVIEFWNRRHEKNILFLKYEDMKDDLRTKIITTSNFLGKNLNNDQISKLEKHLGFSRMSANPAVNYSDLGEYLKFNDDGKFMRKGESGQWRTDMSREIVDQFDTWIRENLKNNESLLGELL